MIAYPQFDVRVYVTRLKCLFMSIGILGVMEFLFSPLLVFQMLQYLVCEDVFSWPFCYALVACEVLV